MFAVSQGEAFWHSGGKHYKHILHLSVHYCCHYQYQPHSTATDLNTLYLNILYQRWRICCVIIPQNHDCVCGNEKWWDYILFIVILDDLRDEMSIFKFPNIFANMMWSLSFPILYEINTRVILGYKWSTSSSMTITITKC